MRKFSKYVALFFVLFVVTFSLSACRKNDDSNGANSVGDNKDDLTSQQIMEYCVNKVDEKLTAGENCFAFQNEGQYEYVQYDENVCLGLTLLKEISKICEIENNVWYCSQTFNVQSEMVDKILALRILNESNDNVVNLSVVIKFSIKGFDVVEKNKTYNLYTYDILYNKETKDVSLEALFEKSRDIEDLEYGSYSKSNYFKFSYSGEIFTTTQFEREIDIEDLENDFLINDASIENYNFLKFNLENNTVITEINGIDYENILKTSIINSIQEIMIGLNNAEMLYTGIVTEEKQFDGMLLKITDAENISQLAG